MTPRLTTALTGFSLIALAAAFTSGAYVGHRMPAGTIISGGAGATTIHYSPGENLEPLDVQLIDGASRQIDLAAYVLTDVAVIDALTRAADRGVKVRLYLFEDQIPTHGKPADALDELRNTPEVETRIKPAHQPLQHLKAFQIDRRLLRTGSANFSASGLKHQDNDLLVIESPAAAEAFREKFNNMWASAPTLDATR
jgi:phosphatidylserine/phosphatidylglycerophosphate/cardiolipin synthase-like enzyme